MSNKFKKLILLCGDIIILYFSLFLTLLIRYQKLPTLNTWEDHFAPFSLAFIFWLLIFYIADLYNLYLAVNNSKFFNLTLKSVGIAGLFTVVFFYLNPKIGISPKTNMMIYVAVFSIMFLLWRRIFNWSLNSYLPKNNIAVIGYNEQVKELIKSLKDNAHLGYRIRLIISNLLSDKVDDILISNDIKNLNKLIVDNNIDTVVTADNPHESQQLRSALFKCISLKRNFINLTNFYESVTGKIPLESINQMWFLENLNEKNKKWFDNFKRTSDLVLAIMILLITLPIWVIIGIIIKLESRGPIFFKQIRAGKDNKKFIIYKFRTMTEVENDRSLTTAGDKRITKFGSFLRKTRIDEIPQVLNIISGSMSFIGPRPERPEFITELEKEIPFYKERMLVKPGITGWDQVSGEYHSPTKEDTMKKLQYDLFYIKNRSLYFDLSIILKTIATVINRKGL